MDRVRATLGDEGFRLLWIGEAFSLVGDQLYLLALPWMALEVAGTGSAVGLVMGLVAVPRAIFMLVGGALTDRLSPWGPMVGSNLARLLLVAALAVLVATGNAHLVTLLCFALALGVADAFYFPAQSAMVPRVLPPEGLSMGNAIIQGTGQFAAFLGPFLGGVTIAALSGVGASTGSSHGNRGVALALAIDACTFLVSIFTLLLMRKHLGAGAGALPEPTDGASGSPATMRSSMVEGLAVLKGDALLARFLALIAAGVLLLSGPLYVGIPVLAKVRYAGGAVAYGAVLSAFAAGSLVGMAVAALASPRPPRPGGGGQGYMIYCPAALGAGLIALGLLTPAPVAMVTCFVMGGFQGYLVVRFITWLQKRVRPDLMGRVMSLLLFVTVGISPLSSTVSGALIGTNPTLLLVGAGSLLLVVVGMGALAGRPLTGARPIPLRAWRRANPSSEVSRLPRR